MNRGDLCPYCLYHSTPCRVTAQPRPVWSSCKEDANRSSGAWLETEPVWSGRWIAPSTRPSLWGMLGAFWEFDFVGRLCFRNYLLFGTRLISLNPDSHPHFSMDFISEEKAKFSNPAGVSIGYLQPYFCCMAHRGKTGLLIESKLRYTPVSC